MKSTLEGNFQFGTKGETLLRLRQHVKNAQLCDQVLFDLNQWEQDPGVWIKKAMGLSSGALVVRSSSQCEDTFSNSMAGAHLSLVGVKRSPGDLKGAINRVVASYPETDAGDDQVLIQPFISGVAVSGVVLTRELVMGGPYYVLNYDDATGRTDTVTGGAESKTLMVHEHATERLESPRFSRLMAAVKEVQTIVGCADIDIEFCITHDEEIYILQVRPIVINKTWPDVDRLAVSDQLITIGHQVKELSESCNEQLVGRRTVLSNMADWNPAEMIGPIPRPLAFSLYKDLITDETWCKARQTMGYRNFPVKPLLVSMGGRPYVDVRLSLNSLLPEGLQPDLADNLVNFQLDLLAGNSNLHDKIEFAVAVTSLDFQFDERTAPLRQRGISSCDRAEFRQRLKELTNRALSGGRDGIQALCDITRRLDINVKGIDSQRRALMRLNACRKYGTHPFSIAARHAFIAVSMLRSLESTGVLGKTTSEDVISSIHTVAVDIVNCMGNVARGNTDQEDFLSQYGFIRPGTYDILSPRYDEKPDLYLGFSGASTPLPINPVEWSSGQISAIDRLMESAELVGGGGELLDYIFASIAAREFIKYKFTKNLSDALQDFIIWGEENGFSREEISFLEIGDFSMTGETDSKQLKEMIARRQSVYQLMRIIRLPAMIVDPIDVEIIRMPHGEPTFITNKTVTGPASIIHEGELTDLKGRIVMINAADPGYDWIFSRQILALVTRYGGPNSHMAIRCAEFGLPAAIGCGDIRFEKLLRASVIELNSGAHTIRPVSKCL